MKVYKLEGYIPYWNNSFKNILINDHIENIVNAFSGINWVEMKNIEVGDINNMYLHTTKDNIPKYIKVVCDDTSYYYFLYENNNLIALDKNRKQVYKANYLLDVYQTVYYNKLHNLILANPLVQFKRKYCDRAKKINDNGTIKYKLDWIADKYQSDTIPDNFSLVRTNSFYTTVDEIWTNNFDFDYPTETKWTAPLENGRYRYIVCKSTALVDTNNNSLINKYTKQTYFVIPIFKEEKDNILHAINDISLTENQTKCLVIGTNNLIGTFDCDLPYSFLYGLVKKYSNNITYNQATNKTNDNQIITINYFEIPLNFPIEIKLMDATKYENGIWGKINYFIKNSDKIIPDTDPFMWNPLYYQEIYNNGSAILINDVSNFVYTWWSESISSLVLQGYLSFDDNLNFGYYYGEKTNLLKRQLDNSNINISTLSIKNAMLAGNSASYFENNVNTGLTTKEVRQNEQLVSWIDYGFNTANKVIQAGTSWMNPLNWFGNSIAKTASAAIFAAKGAVDTAYQNINANKQFRGQINSIVSSPGNIINNPFVKAAISNNGELFKHWTLELHPYDKERIFADRLNNGAIYNKIDYLQSFRNRKYMNILDIDTYYNYETLLSIIEKTDTTIFNNKFWNDSFFNWLNNSYKVYETMNIINVLDWKANDYINNIESEFNYPMEQTKTNIETYNKFRTEYSVNNVLNEWAEDNNINYIEELEVVSIVKNAVAIQAKKDSEHYYGNLVINADIYNGYILDDKNNKYYFYDFNQVFCNSTYTNDCNLFSKQLSIRRDIFNYDIIFNDTTNIDFINDKFLMYARVFDKSLIIPNNITKIGSSFLYEAKKFNSSISLSNNLKEIDIYFMWKCSEFNQVLTLPNSLENIGNYFLAYCSEFNQVLTLSNTLKTIGNHFLVNCKKFNQPLILPNSLEGLDNIGTTFMFNCYNFENVIYVNQLGYYVIKDDEDERWGSFCCDISTAACYTNGIRINGADANNWVNKFKKRNEAPYRKLIVYTIIK